MTHFDRAGNLHFDAAEGWLDLRNLKEAESELDQVSPEFQQDQDVLALRYEIYGRAKGGIWPSKSRPR